MYFAAIFHSISFIIVFVQLCLFVRNCFASISPQLFRISGTYLFGIYLFVTLIAIGKYRICVDIGVLVDIEMRPSAVMLNVSANVRSFFYFLSSW